MALLDDAFVKLRRIALSLPAMLVAAVALLLSGTRASAGATDTPAPPPVSERAPEPLRKGNLFSAVPVAQTPLGSAWEALREEARVRFPRLNLTRREDLHVTVVYIGGNWDPADTSQLRALAQVAPTGALCLSPSVARLGASGHAVAVELHGPRDRWADAVVAAKDVLNWLGLKRPDAYDSNFRPHVTLARAAGSRPTEQESEELAAFQKWLEERVEKDPGAFTLQFVPETPVRLWLAGATRPAGASEYIPVEDLLERLASPRSP